MKFLIKLLAVLAIAYTGQIVVETWMTVATYPTESGPVSRLNETQSRIWAAEANFKQRTPVCRWLVRSVIEIPIDDCGDSGLGQGPSAETPLDE